MTVTAATIQANILKELSVDSANTVLLARALRWMNKSMDKFQGFIIESEFLQKSESKLTTIADQATYALPADHFDMLILRDDTNKTTIQPKTREEFDRAHTDPSTESTGKPYEYTMEYDRSAGRHIMRLALIPDSTYDLYAVTRNWHPTLTSNQGLIYDKLETAIEEGGIYHGALSLYSDPEYANYRAELKSNWLEAVQNLSQILEIQKPKPAQIPIRLKGTFRNWRWDNTYYG
jgi:hypothetical protein